MPVQSQPSRVARARLRQLDERLTSLEIPAKPSKGWIKAIREVLGMTQKQLGQRLAITRQGVSDLERQEAAGRVNLETLARAAEQLGCELQYSLVPKTSLSDFLDGQAMRRANQKILGVNASQSLEDARLSHEQVRRSVEDLALEMKLNRARDLWDKE